MRTLVFFNLENLFIASSELRYSPTPFLRRQINKIWKVYLLKAKKNNRPIWNGKVYRLENITKNRNAVYLKLGFIDYKTYLSSFDLKNVFNKYPFQERPNGLYVASHIITKDGKFIIGQTADNSLFKHNFDLISGSLNYYNKKKIKTAEDIKLFWQSELMEEASIPAELIEKIEGICITVTSSGRIGFFFQTKLKITAIDFKKTAKINFEHKKLLLLNKEELLLLINNKKFFVNPAVKYTYKFIENKL
ncbi:MAG: hypothetical protein COX79_01005 [Candidatus Levybacteria bacterium CG_4_10_14_0_2_um_filter_36_16]|nr:MAG: hypothetical protein AUK12_03790 [Candidatus Levybacteria bacterium CG2_30_37_29]PIR78930.1 MAG: hypothetical protein COU26_03855 [Candidatus Levybacteria bacterium CG10_big_fil_rev_8_21_14_0_10_36_30]PIZ97719.1 MAG: hypothetical protein COX79_01005 [Candidatus Levybacteria bacterium CG_4_10_14_0_2_um_filter_36_16]PJA90820.1 MAG: hypothetical protein CO136_00360 [Candidatus Levybacteria bacterium CG_4_9_14_3_um_filter_36_7]